MNKTATIRLLTAVATGITNGMSKRAYDHISYTYGPKLGINRSSTAPIDPLSRKGFLMGVLGRMAHGIKTGDSRYITNYNIRHQVNDPTFMSAAIDRDVHNMVNPFTFRDVPDRQKWLDKRVFRNLAQRFEFEDALEKSKINLLDQMNHVAPLISPEATDLQLRFARGQVYGPYRAGQSPADRYEPMYDKEYPQPK